MSTPADSPKTFISYAREDSEFALKLARDLREAGANVWIDQLDIPAGARWDRAVEVALAECPRMLVILSPASVSSENVMDEVSYALDERKPIIPALYQECELPLRLRRLQRINVRDGLTGLLATLGINKAASGSLTIDEEAILAIIGEHPTLSLRSLTGIQKGGLEYGIDPDAVNRCLLSLSGKKYVEKTLGQKGERWLVTEAGRRHLIAKKAATQIEQPGRVSVPRNGEKV